MEQLRKYAHYRRKNGDSYETIYNFLKSKNLKEEDVDLIISEVKEADKEREEQEKNDGFAFLRDTPEEIEEKKKRKEILFNAEKELFRKRFRTQTLLSLIMMIFGISLHLYYGNESRSSNSILAQVIIVASWAVFFYGLLNHWKLKGYKMFALPLSIVFMLLSIFIIDKIVYGGDIKRLIADLDSKSPSISTIIIDEEYQPSFWRKGKTTSDAWTYRYEIFVNGIKYTGATPFSTDRFEIGDSVKVIYDDGNPSISKIIE